MSTQQVFVAQDEVVDCDIGGDRALLHLESNTYFTLNATASTIWLAMSEPKSLDDLVAVVTDRFEVSETQCRPDIEALLSQMIEAEVIGVAPSGSG
jgi:hypothetical protein